MEARTEAIRLPGALAGSIGNNARRATLPAVNACGGVHGTRVRGRATPAPVTPLAKGVNERPKVPFLGPVLVSGTARAALSLPGHDNG